ncbi:ATPase 2, plasma membrane-type [Cyclospora cayetanensis]|uniref:P-type H(+)-exporting transporter n=1 Tax=Cyclospora cayetanensis TaxID=88456 RepID=A0A6P6S3F6_9EIME|nr:ATPase 2, plasma membrane-type [Cyclospora cayetanensis]
MESHLNSSTMHQVETVCQQASIEAPSHHASEHTANEECYEPQGQPEQPDNTSVLPSEALLPEQCQHSREFTSLSQDAVVPVYNVGLNDELSDTGLTNERAAELREVFGPNSVKSKQTPEWQKVAKRYLRTTPILLTISAIMSVCIKIDGKRDWLSFSLLVFLCNVMVWADYMGERTAANAISAVEKLAAPECSAKRDGVWSSIEVVDLVPGDVVWLKAGMIVPADGVFIPHQKYIFLDESALTGESLAVKKCRGAELLSGSVVQRGEGSMLVQKTGVDSFYGKTIALLARADRKGHLRTILDSASKALTLAAVIFALFLVFWERFHPAWIEKRNGEVNLGLLLKRAFTLIAAVIPAAMPVVTTTVLAVGAVSMSREHAVVSRLSAIEEAAGVEILCTDKTGTLTLNKLTLSREDTSVEPGFTTNQLLVYASLATSCTEPDPIDLAINAEANMQERAEFEVLDYTPFNPVDKRADSIVRTKSGEVLFVTKGAPHVIGELVCAPGDTMKLQRLNSIIEDKARRGLRTLGVAIKPIAFKGTEILEEATEALSSTMWELVGFLCLRDPPRADTRETLERSKQMGVQIKMLTGDQRAIAAETARLLGLGDNICGPEIFKERPKGLESDLQFDEFISKVDGFSGVYPEHKFDIVDTLQRSGCLVAMTGDGVNDAPALKRATVGIAVSGATEAARAAADITLLSPGLSSIITVLSLSRQIFKRIEAYITFRIHGSVMTLLFWWGCVVIFDYEYPTWVLALVAIINDFVLMSCSRDNVPSSKLQRASSTGFSKSIECLGRRFFSESSLKGGDKVLYARSLLIDMEAKAVQNCLVCHPPLSSSKSTDLGYSGRTLYRESVPGSTMDWCWKPECAFWQQGGCGNNWAIGHELQGPSNHDTLESLITSLAEDADAINSVLILHSVAGGTGSGVGSYMTELCADLLPTSCIASCCVWPFESEVSTQSLNAMLTLASLQRDSDGIFIFENARCAKALQRHSAATPAGAGANFSGINRYISRELLGCCLLPSDAWDHSSKGTSRCSGGQLKKFENKSLTCTDVGCGALRSDAASARHCPLRDVVADVAAHPAFKLLTCRYLPQNFSAESSSSGLAPYTFRSLLCRLQRMFKRADSLDFYAPPSPAFSCRSRQSHYAEVRQQNQSSSFNEGNAEDAQPNIAVAARLCLRGPKSKSFDGNPVDDCNIALWPYALGPIKVSSHPFPALGEPCSASLTTSCCTPLPALRSTLEMSRDLLHAGAFVHHYEQFGVGAEELRFALEQMEEIIAAYAAIRRA